MEIQAFEKIRLRSKLIQKSSILTPLKIPPRKVVNLFKNGKKKMQTLFWISVLFIIYTYIGYPLLVYYFGQYKVRPEYQVDPELKVAVIIVVHNEAQQIAKKIYNLQAQDYNNAIKQIIIVSDASSDQTETIVQEIQRQDQRVELCVMPVKSGKATGINVGMSKVTADIVVFADARQEFSSDAISKLLNCFGDPEVGAAAGELRFRNPEESTSVAQSIGLYWRYETWIRSSESDFYSLTGAPGAIYAIRKEYFVPLPNQLILDDVWTPTHIILAKKRVAYCAAAIAWDYAQEKGKNEFKRKVRTLAGNLELVSLQPKVVLPWHNRYWWMFVSHKLFRMLVPFAFLLAFFSNLFIWEPAYTLVLGLQIVFYSLGYIGFLDEKQTTPHAKNKLCAVIYVFLMMNLAAIYGWIYYFKGEHNKLWQR